MRKNLFKRISFLLAVIAVLVALVWSGARLLPLPQKALSAGPGLRIVYGHVSAAGTVLDGSGDWTVTHTLGPCCQPLANTHDVYDIAFGAPGFTEPPSVVALPQNSGASTGGNAVHRLIVEAPTVSGVRIRTGSELWRAADFAFIAMGKSTAPSTGVNVLWGKVNGGRGGGVPGATVDPGSGGWSSYYESQARYRINFDSGLFTETPAVVASMEERSPVDCYTYDNVSSAGVSINNWQSYCNWHEPSWGYIDFLAVGKGVNPRANLQIVEGVWDRGDVYLGTPVIHAGDTGNFTVANGGGWNPPVAYTVNFSPGTFAQTPTIITNASHPYFYPFFCAGPYSTSPYGTNVLFTGGFMGFSWGKPCTYGGDRFFQEHGRLGATMIAVGVSPIPPVIASCNVDNGNPPGANPVATFTAASTGGIAPYSYQWLYPPGLSTCAGTQTCSTNPLASSIGPGTFMVNVIGSDTSQSGYVLCPQVNVTTPSKVSASFLDVSKQLTATVSALINTTTSAVLYIRNIGPVSSTMDWECNVDPTWPVPVGLTIDTSRCNGGGVGLRGGAPDFP